MRKNEQKDTKKPASNKKPPVEKNDKKAAPPVPGKSKFFKKGEETKKLDKELLKKQLKVGQEKIENPEITDKVKVDFEPAITEDVLFYVMEGDLSDVDEFKDILEELAKELSEEEDLTEALSVSQRLRRRAIMRRSRSRIKLGRRRAMMRRATTQRIQKRARRSAISMMKKRFAGGRNPGNLPYSERARVERMVARRKPAVNRLSRRLVRSKREQERKRFQKNSFEMSGNILNEEMPYRKVKWDPIHTQVGEVLRRMNISPTEFNYMLGTLGVLPNPKMSGREAVKLINKYKQKYGE